MPMTFQIPESAFAPFYDTPVAFHGERAGARPVDLTVMCMITEDTVSLPGEAIAPTRERTFNLSFPRSNWREGTAPQIGEWLRWRWTGEELWARVDSVSHMPDGDFILVATWKPDRKGGPSW